MTSSRSSRSIPTRSSSRSGASTIFVFFPFDPALWAVGERASSALRAFLTAPVTSALVGVPPSLWDVLIGVTFSFVQSALLHVRSFPT